MSRLKASLIVAAAARGLAAVLAGGLLVVELLVANGGFHQALHQSGQAAPDNCILCLFVKGHVDLSQPMPTLAPPVLVSFDPPPQTESIALVDFSYLASPSRAPPAHASFPAAVA